MWYITSRRICSWSSFFVGDETGGAVGEGDFVVLIVDPAGVYVVEERSFVFGIEENSEEMGTRDTGEDEMFARTLPVVELERVGADVWSGVFLGDFEGEGSELRLFAVEGFVVLDYEDLEDGVLHSLIETFKILGTIFYEIVTNSKFSLW